MTGKGSTRRPDGSRGSRTAAEARQMLRDAICVNLPDGRAATWSRYDTTCLLDALWAAGVRPWDWPRDAP